MVAGNGAAVGQALALQMQPNIERFAKWPGPAAWLGACVRVTPGRPSQSGTARRCAERPRRPPGSGFP